MKPSLAHAVAITAVALIAGSHTARPADAAAPSRLETIASLTVIDQTFNLVPDSPLTITVQLPPELIAEPFPADAAVVITSYDSIVQREVFLAALDGTLERNVDSVDVSLDPAVADPALSHPAPELITVTIPTESNRRRTAALQFPDPGVHPVVIDIRVGARVIAETTTFIHRLRIAGTPSDDMAVALLLAQTSTPDVDVDGTVTVSADAIDEYRALADSLEAISGAGAALGLAAPRAVQIEPSMLQALAAQDPDLAARLGNALAGSTSIAMPRLPLDPSGATAAGEDDQYTLFLRQGEDLAHQLLPQGRVDRSIFVAREGLTAAAATLRGNLGTRLLVTPFDDYLTTEGNTGLFTDTTQLLTTTLADNSQLPTAVIDPYLDDQLDRVDDPFNTAIEVVSELLVLGAVVEGDGGIASRHGMVLGTTDVGVPDAALLGALTTLLLSTDGVALVDAPNLVTTVDTWLVDGRAIELTLPQTTDLDLKPRFELIGTTAESIFAYASVLPDSDPRASAWVTVLDALPSTAVSESGASAMVDQLGEQFVDIAGCVLAPAPFSFTLTGKNNTFQFKMTNRCVTDLRVRLRLSSAKLAFPDGDQLVTLTADGETTVQVRAEALSNGKSSVFLRVYAPATDDVLLVPEVPLTARVNSLAGLGKFLTGAGLLLIVSWWAHNWRRSRRTLQSAHHIGRHPASNGNGSDNGNGNGNGDAPGIVTETDLAPDAAASSVPPS
jgi:hypothetical protein